MSTESLLDKLKPNGLSGVRSDYPWDEKNGTTEMAIFFMTPRRAKSASFLLKQIEIAVCNSCELKGKGCTGVKTDFLHQVLARVESDHLLDKDGWRTKLLSLPCNPELSK
jgi:hypothetical protein